MITRGGSQVVSERKMKIYKNYRVDGMGNERKKDYNSRERARFCRRALNTFTRLQALIACVSPSRPFLSRLLHSSSLHNLFFFFLGNLLIEQL